MNIRGTKKQFLVAAFAVILVSGVCFIFSRLIDYRLVSLVLLVTVSLIAVSFDIWPVLFAATLSALTWDFFFIPPRFAFHVNSTEDTILLIMYFIIALISGVLTYKIRKAEKESQLKEERANSVKLYNTILNSLSHELRTPIATIIGATDNLLSNTFLTNANKDELVGEISKASLRLNQQVENLLNISRLESGHIMPKPDWCDVEELVYEVVRQVEENVPGRSIGINIQPDLPLCFIDKGMLEQVIYNLLNNAAIHTNSQCSIDIAVSCHTDLLEIILVDEGGGFKGLDISDVFHKFSRHKSTDTHGQGSGLGLSIVKGFTDALGGTVELIASRQTRFTIILPVKTFLK